MADVVLVINIPTPYREPVHERVAEALNGSYHVIYCKRLEPNRAWRFTPGNYPHGFLRPNMINYRGKYVHLNLDIWGMLTRLNPAVVIVGGLNPTGILAFAWTRRHRRAHIALTEGTPIAESHLSRIRTSFRRFVFSRSAALLGVSQQTMTLFATYGCSDRKTFRTCYSVDNELYAPASEPADHDVMFAGQIIDRKQPLFFAEVADGIRRRRGACRALVVGSGSQEAALLTALDRARVQWTHPGFVQPSQLPGYFTRARVFLFPTLTDTWGVVANEACAAGLPIITSPYAGCAHDLVRHETNGYVLPLNVETWADAATSLLENHALYDQYSRAARNVAKEFTHDQAAQGILEAIAFARAQKPL